jgi:hypothetical protein
MECCSKWNVTQNVMSHNMECHSKWKVTQNLMSLKLECHSKYKVTKNVKEGVKKNWICDHTRQGGAGGSAGGDLTLTPNRFLDALASLVLLIAHWLTHSPIGNWWSYTTLVLIIEIETPASHSKLNVTQIGMSLKMECHSKRIVTQNGMPFKMECHSKLNVPQNVM